MFPIFWLFTSYFPHLSINLFHFLFLIRSFQVLLVLKKIPDALKKILRLITCTCKYAMCKLDILLLSFVLFLPLIFTMFMFYFTNIFYQILIVLYHIAYALYHCQSIKVIIWEAKTKVYENTKSKKVLDIFSENVKINFT